MHTIQGLTILDSRNISLMKNFNIDRKSEILHENVSPFCFYSDAVYTHIFVHAPLNFLGKGNHI